jgi:hypothetical protein
VASSILLLALLLITVHKNQGLLLWLVVFASFILFHASYLFGSLAPRENLSLRTVVQEIRKPGEVARLSKVLMFGLLGGAFAVVVVFVAAKFVASFFNAL